MTSCHTCDCQTGPSEPDRGQARVWSPRTHVQARLTELTGAPELVGDGPTWAARLTDLLERLTPTERSGVRVSVPGGDVLDAATALTRAQSPWLPSLLRDDGLHMAFQPIVDLRTGRLHGREALVRARVDGRELSGGQIVGAAQAHDALFQLDVRARTLAIETAAGRLGDGEMLFVNFNPVSIYDPEICLRTTWAVARRVGLALDRICFEVVETERYPDLAFLQRILDRYRQEGAKVALDDLGAGHASLDYLRLLRPDVVKLDRHLTTSLAEDPARQRLVGAIIDYAHELSVTVVAEGLETAADVAAVRRLGADLGQGYYLGRPSPEIVPVDPALVLEAGDEDPETGLLTGAAFERRLAAALGSDVPVAVVLLEPDPWAADAPPEAQRSVGRQLAERLRRTVRCDDLVTGVGDDGFLVAITDTDVVPDGLRALAEELATRVLGAPFEVDGELLVCRAAVGGALAPHDGADVTTLVRRAEATAQRGRSSAQQPLAADR